MMSLLSYHAVDDYESKQSYRTCVLSCMWNFIFLDFVVHALKDHGVTSGKKYKRAFVGDMLHSVDQRRGGCYFR